MSEQATYRWSCSSCKREFRIREGKAAPELCPECSKIPFNAVATEPLKAAEPKPEPAPSVVFSPIKDAREDMKILTGSGARIVAVLGVVTLWFCVWIAYGMFANITVKYGEFQSSNAYGATANAVIAIGEQNRHIFFIGCAILVVMGMQSIQASALRQEVRALRNDLAKHGEKILKNH